MDNSIREFLLLVKKLLVEVRTLNFNFLALQERVETIRAKSEAEKDAAADQQKFPDRTTAQVEFVSEKVNQYYTKYNKPKRLQWASFLVSVATFIAVAVYAAINYCMLGQMRIATEKAGIGADAAQRSADIAKQTLQDSIESFRIDERAWVELEPIKPTLLAPANTNQPTFFSCSIYPKNVGKTVATNVVVKAVSLGRGGEFNPSEMRMTQDKFLLDKFKESGTSKHVLVPANPVPKVLAPNTTANAPFIVDCQAIKTFPTGGSWYTFVVGRIDYCDQFNVRHWRKFCFFVASSRGDVWNCKEGNDEDSNPEIEPTEKCTTQ